MTWLAKDSMVDTMSRDLKKAQHIKVKMDHN